MLAIPTSCFVQRTSTCASFHFSKKISFNILEEVDNVDVIIHNRAVQKFGDQFDWFYLKRLECLLLVAL